MKKALLVLMLTSFSFLTACVNNDNTQQVEEYTVTFIVDGNKEEVVVKSGETVKKPDDPVVVGYNFIGWFSDEACETPYSFENGVNSNITIYAGFEKIPEIKYYTVTFELNGGTLEGETSIQVKEGDLVTKPTNPEKNGYRFLNWYSDETITNVFNFDTTIITANTTIYAGWELIEVETLFNITSSSDESVTTRADFAVDGNDETYWKAKDNKDQFLTIDLEGVKEVTHVSQTFADLSTWNFTIKGSIDGNEYVEILSNETLEIGSKYERDLTGFYRYIKLEIPESSLVATSKEFSVSFNELDKGTNVAYGMKGIADCWAGGYETELLFDGRLDNFHCGNSNHGNHYYGFDGNTTFYIDNIEIYFPNECDHKFFVDYARPDGSWYMPDNCNFNENADSKNYFKIDIKDTLTALLVHYNGNSLGHWPAGSELKANGFVINKDRIVTENVIDLGSYSYLSRIDTNGQTGLSFEISSDGTNFESIETTNDGNYHVFNKECRYVRISGGTDLESYKIFSQSFIRNLALGTKPVATTRSADAGYWENMMTLNKNDKEAAKRFYCSSGYELEEEINLDLGVNVLANDIYYKYQDPTDQNNYQLKIEISKDGTNYSNVLDTTANENGGMSGQIFIAELKEENKEFRYLKIHTKVSQGWTNCNTLAIHGVGSPII